MAHNESAPALPSLRWIIRRLQATGDTNALNQPNLRLWIIVAVPEAVKHGRVVSRVHASAWLRELLGAEQHEESPAAASVWVVIDAVSVSGIG
jgi:hypothetical protein